LSGSSSLTCLACEALPVAYATASIALGIMWPHKPHHYVKVGIPWGGGRICITLWKEYLRIEELFKYIAIFVVKAKVQRTWDYRFYQLWILRRRVSKMWNNVFCCLYFREYVYRECDFWMAMWIGLGWKQSWPGLCNIREFVWSHRRKKQCAGRWCSRPFSDAVCFGK
jgi:hypothetical protein